MPVDILHLVVEPFFNFFSFFLEKDTKEYGIEEESEAYPCSEVYVEYDWWHNKASFCIHGDNPMWNYLMVLHDHII